MTSELVQLTFDKILQARTYTVIILACAEKRFAIYVEPTVGRTLQNLLTGVEKERPQTHDLMCHMLSTMGVRVKQVVLSDLQETTYFARLFIEQEIGPNLRHVIELDARPSDCLILAFKENSPLFATKAVVEKAIHIED